MKWSQRSTDFRRSALYRELKRRDDFRAVCTYQNLIDTVCEKYKPTDGESFMLTLPEQDWLAELELHHNAKATLMLVLEVARSHGAVTYELLDGKISIHIPHLLEIADNWTKKKVREYGPAASYRENIKGRDKEYLFSDDLNDKENRLLHLTKDVLSKRATDQFVELPPMIEQYFEKFGEEVSTLGHVVALIEEQFAGTDRQRQIGTDLINKVKKACEQGIKNHGAEKVVLAETSKSRDERILREQKLRGEALARLTSQNTPKTSRLKRKQSSSFPNGAIK